MAKTNNLTDFLKDLADGIRYALTGTTAGATINPQSFRSKITEIYNKGKLDGKPNFGSNKAVQASDVRSVDDNGKALYYYDKAQDKVTQGGMTVTKAKSYNGSKVQQTISGNTYLSGDIKINSVSGSNIKPEYIKKDIYVRVGSGGNTLYDATGTYVGTVFAVSVGHSTSGNHYGWAEAIQAVSGYWSMSAKNTGGSTLDTTATITCSKAGKYTFHYSGTSSVTSNISGFGNGKTITVTKGKTITIKAGNNREILWIEAI